MGELKCTDS